jgi:hypothetical protein
LGFSYPGSVSVCGFERVLKHRGTEGTERRRKSWRVDREWGKI